MKRTAITPTTSSAPEAGPDPFAELIALARKCPARPRLYRESLGIIVRHLRSPYGALHVRYHSEVIQDEAHHGPQDPNFWKASGQMFLTESLAEGRPRARLLKSKLGDTRVALLSAPLYDPAGPAIGAIALVTYVGSEAEWNAKLGLVEALCRLISFGAEFVGTTPPEAASRGTEGALVKAAAMESVEEFAFTLTNELCNKLGCNQVALGLVEGKVIRITSVSGFDQVGARTPGVVSLKAAMEECLDAGQVIQCPPDDHDPDRSGGDYRLHKQWHAAAGGDMVASVPLKVGDRVAAVLSLRRGKDRSLTREQLDQLATRIAPMTPAMLIVSKANRGLARHARDSTRSFLDSLRKPGHRGRKVGFTAVVVFLAFFCFAKVDYHVRVPCIVALTDGRHVSAPFSGLLAASYVIPGDRVQQGQVLAAFDHRELDQQVVELTAQWSVLERERDRAMAADTPVEVALAVANQKLVEAKLAITKGRIQRATVVAPMDGIVVQGDLRQRIGDRLAEGEPLFQIASPSGWKAELEIPEHVLTQVTAGLAGAFVSFGQPDQPQSFRIERVQPAAILRKEKNVFLAEAMIDKPAEWMRPGMEGIARIHAGPRPVRWIVLHRLFDYLRLHFWL